MTDHHETAPETTFLRRRRDWTGILLRLAEVGLILLLVATLTSSDSKRTDADNRTDRLAACRGLFNSDKETARTVWSDAVSERDKVQTLILVALANSEIASAQELAGQLQAKFDTENAAVAKLDQTTADYTAASAMAVTDPDAFLAACNSRADTGGG